MHACVRFTLGLHLFLIHLRRRRTRICRELWKHGNWWHLLSQVRNCQPCAESIQYCSRGERWNYDWHKHGSANLIFAANLIFVEQLLFCGCQLFVSVSVFIFIFFFIFICQLLFGLCLHWTDHNYDSNHHHNHANHDDYHANHYNDFLDDHHDHNFNFVCQLFYDVNFSSCIFVSVLRSGPIPERTCLHWLIRITRKLQRRMRYQLHSLLQQ